MSNMSERSAVFVGCARNCRAYLDQVLGNVERMAALYAKAAFIFVENDSEDGSKAALLQWLDSRPSGILLELDGLAATESSRTARLARARNGYLGHLRESPFIGYDDLVVLDFDDVNATPLDLAAFSAAADFLHADDETVGVFANSRPVYFDIWALRHPNWCPNDCWAEVHASRDASPAEAAQRFIFARQIAIDPGQPPIGVASAFGGLGIYRLAKVLPHRYVGTTSVGTDVCEHVSLNLELSRSGRLFIFPALQNLAPQEHLRPNQVPTRQLRLEQDGRSCVLLAPPEHRLDVYRAASPLYDRRLPLLSRLVAAAAPGGAIIDVGANIGDTVALCRMAGCDAPFIAIEPSVQYFAVLEANRQALPELFKDVRTLHAFIGVGSEQLSLVEGAGTARVEKLTNPHPPSDTPTVPLGRVTDQEVSLIKTDTDGYDAAILSGSVEFLRRSRPVIWAEAEVSDPSDEQRWSQLCADLSESHPYMCIFDNFGFLVAHGAVADKQVTFLDLLRYTRRHKAGDAKNIGPPTIYYIDVAFFPATKFDVYTAFVNALIESAL
jgi:FkbM family methyltransferase